MMYEEMMAVASDTIEDWICPTKINPNQFFICASFLNNQCGKNTKCALIHLPICDENKPKTYMWLYQRRDQENGHFRPVNSELNEELEQNYKDPAKSFYQRVNDYGNTCINFENFEFGELNGILVKYKRLSTQSLVNVEHELKKFSTHWIWYWKNDDSKIIPLFEQSYYAELLYQIYVSSENGCEMICVNLNDKIAILSFNGMTLTFYDDSSKTYNLKRRPINDIPTREMEIIKAPLSSYENENGEVNDNSDTDGDYNVLDHEKRNHNFRKLDAYHSLSLNNYPNLSAYSYTDITLKLGEGNDVKDVGEPSKPDNPYQYVLPKPRPRSLSREKPMRPPRPKNLNNGVATLDEVVLDRNVQLRQSLMEIENEKATLCRTLSVHPPTLNDDKTGTNIDERENDQARKMAAEQNRDDRQKQSVGTRNEESKLRSMYDQYKAEGLQDFAGFKRLCHLIVNELYPRATESTHDEKTSWKKGMIQSLLGANRLVQLKNETLIEFIDEQFDRRVIEIIAVKENRNFTLIGNLTRQKNEMRNFRKEKECGTPNIEKKLLWYPIKWKQFEEVCTLNVNSNLKQRGYLGSGFYFYKSPKLCMKDTDVDKENARCLLLCEVLVGKTVQGKEGFDQTTSRFDSCVDDVNKPSVFVLFNVDQIFPKYAVIFKEKSAKMAISPPP